jgi:hypothetical protein
MAESRPLPQHTKQSNRTIKTQEVPVAAGISPEM